MKALATLFLLLPPLTAQAHDWYSIACCSDRDCKPVPSDSIKWTPSGWLVIATGELIPEEKTQQSQDNQFHRCSRHFANSYNADRTICLYVPDAGA